MDGYVLDHSARWMVVAMLGLLGLGIVMAASATAVQESLAGQPLVMFRSHLVRVASAIEERWLVRENPQASITFQRDDGVVVSFTRHAPDGGQGVFPRVE